MLALAWLSCPVHALSRIQADNWRHRLNYLRLFPKQSQSRILRRVSLSPYRHHAWVILLISTPYAQGSLTKTQLYISHSDRTVLTGFFSRDRALRQSDIQSNICRRDQNLRTRVDIACLTESIEMMAISIT